MVSGHECGGLQFLSCSSIATWSVEGSLGKLRNFLRSSWLLREPSTLHFTTATVHKCASLSIHPHLLQGEVSFVDHSFPHQHHRLYLPLWLQLRHLPGRGECRQHWSSLWQKLTERSLYWMERDLEAHTLFSGKQCIHVQRQKKRFTFWFVNLLCIHSQACSTTACTIESTPTWSACIALLQIRQKVVTRCYNTAGATCDYC